MKKHTFIIAAVAALAGTAQAQIGENVAELVARYGQPENPMALLMGAAEWKTQQADVSVILKDGKTDCIMYDGEELKSDYALVKNLLGRNLPKGQKWEKLPPGGDGRQVAIIATVWISLSQSPGSASSQKVEALAQAVRARVPVPKAKAKGSNGANGSARTV
jgi:hypothetical protein